MSSLSFLNILTLVVFTLIVLNEIRFTKSQDTIAQQLTIHVQPGYQECFYQPMGPNRTLTIDFAVIATSQGGHDIDFQLMQPDGRPMISEFRKAASTPTIRTLDLPGVYRFCFDNTFSRVSRKTVTFNVISAEVDSDPVSWEAYNKKNLSPEGEYSMTVEEIMKTVDKVRIRLDDIQVIQDTHRVIETRDRSTVENSYERINFWSVVCIFAILIFGSIQVMVLRSLFEDKYRGIYTFIDKKIKG